MTGIELCARLAALIPPPRYPLVRYHGVLAPRSSWRKASTSASRTWIRTSRKVHDLLADDGLFNLQWTGIRNLYNPQNPRSRPKTSSGGSS